MPPEIWYSYLGTGLVNGGGLIENPMKAHYNSTFPIFPLATVEFHSGQIDIWHFEGKRFCVAAAGSIFMVKATIFWRR